MGWLDRLRGTQTALPPVRDTGPANPTALLRDLQTEVDYSRTGVLFGGIQEAGRKGLGEANYSAAVVKGTPGASRIERALLYQLYLQSSWVAACVDLIARRATAGGFDFRPLRDGASPKNRELLEQWFGWINPRQDFRDITRVLAQGVLIWGDGYLEMTRDSKLPFEIYTLDPISMDKKADIHGNILGYEQYESDPHEAIKFTPDEVINVCQSGPRGGLYGVSPLRKLLLPTTMDLFAQQWNRNALKHGTSGIKAVEMPLTSDEAQARRMQAYWDENYAGARNAGKDVVLFGGAKLNQVGQSPAEMSYLEGRKYSREEILGVFGVPSHMLGIPEAGSLGGGPATEAAERVFYHNVIEPLQGLLLEQLNFYIIEGAPGSFGIDDWALTFKNMDFRDTATRAAEAKTKTEIGVWSVDEARKNVNTADDRDPVPGGDRHTITTRTGLVPVDEIPDMQPVALQNQQADQQGDSHDQSLDQGKANLDRTKVQTDQMKKQANQKTAGKKKNTEREQALRLWQRKALRRVSEGRSPVCEFTSTALATHEKDQILRCLAEAGRGESAIAKVRTLFEHLQSGPVDAPAWVDAQSSQLATSFASFGDAAFDRAEADYLGSDQ